VIAVCGSVKNPSVANERMLAVHDALRRANIDLDELEVWQVTDGGVITTRRLGQLA
jgi:nicotinamide mononucleotide adenylyltransferase